MYFFSLPCLGCQASKTPLPPTTLFSKCSRARFFTIAFLPDTSFLPYSLSLTMEYSTTTMLYFMLQLDLVRKKPILYTILHFFQAEFNQRIVFLLFPKITWVQLWRGFQRLLQILLFWWASGRDFHPLFPPRISQWTSARSWGVFSFRKTKKLRSQQPTSE